MTMNAVLAFGEVEKLGTRKYAGPKVKKRLFEKTYMRYDSLQDSEEQSYWNGYNDCRQKE